MAAASPAVSMVAAWLADSMMAVVSTEVDFVVANFTAVDFMIATSGATASDSATATTRTTTMTTTTLTTAVAMWFIDACTPRMAGAGNPFRCAVDGQSYNDVDRDLERSLTD